MKVRFLIAVQVFTALVVLVVGLLALEEGRRGLLGSPGGPSVSQVYQVLQAMRIYILAGAGLAGLAGVVLALSVARPLLGIRQEVQSISRGNLRLRSDTHVDYEVVPLKGAVENMIGALSDYILKSMTGGAFCLNATGEITYFSPTAEIVFGRDAWEMVGKSYTQVLPPTPRNQGLVSTIGQCLEKLQGVTGNPVLMENAAKEQLPVRLTTAVLEGEKEVLLGVVVNLTDPTQVKELQERLLRRDRLASLGFLAAGTAHEIRNPLGSLKGLTQLLQENMEAGDPRRSYIDVIVREVDRLNDSVEKLIRFAEPDDGVVVLESVTKLMSHEVQKVRSVAALRGISLVEHYQTDIPEIEVSGRSLAEAFAHLLADAVERSPRDSMVSIQVIFESDQVVQRNTPSGRIVTEIGNTAVLLPGAERKRLFDPFYGSRKSDFGLELAIAHQIISHHRGTLDSVTNADGNMAIRICLPVHAIPAKTGALYGA